MSILTSLTRAYLTKSFRSFTFVQDSDNTIFYDNLENMGLYVHIPFCRKICDFCPYCKEVYIKEKCEKYIDSLIEEIHLVCKVHPKKEATSLYFGGGSPALAADRIGEIVDTLKMYFNIREGIGVELHPSDVSVPTLEKLKNAGVTKISIGIQSFNPKFAGLLGRKSPDMCAIKDALEKVNFETVSMDFIFALPGQSFADLKIDIENAFSCGANHIAIYPFIDFTFTDSEIRAMNKREKRNLLDEITLYCAQMGYTRDSIWTFSKANGAKYSSMTRDNFLGFGCSATTLTDKKFKINTFSTDAYIECVGNGLLASSLKIDFTLRQRMVYYLFWTAYTTRVESKAFEKFFGKKLEKMYGFELFVAKMLGFVTHSDGVYTLTPKGAFYYHCYESFYTLSYIDKMWGIMRNEAFPQGLKL